MKQLSDIKKEKQELLNTYVVGLKKREIDKIVSRLDFLKTCQYYLEKEPQIEFILSECNRITDRLSILSERFLKYQENNSDKLFNWKTEKKKFEDDNGVALLKIQLKTLQFLKD